MSSVKQTDSLAAAAGACDAATDSRVCHDDVEDDDDDDNGWATACWHSAADSGSVADASRAAISVRIVATEVSRGI